MLRGIVEKHLNMPLSDAEWNLAKNERWTSNFPPAAIAAKIQQWRDATGSRTPTPPTVSTAFRADPARKAHEELLSHFITRMAEWLEPVKSFRQEVLGGKLLKVAHVEAWIKERSETEKYTVWFDVPVRPDAMKARRRFDTSKMASPGDFELRWLKYSLPGQASQQVPTAGGLVLDRLRRVSESVAKLTTCPESYATTFVLSGEPLPFFSCEQTVRIVSTDRVSALNRIELSIDPTVSPRQVAETYRRIRAEVFRRRYRAMSEKHIRLALFGFSRPHGGALRTAMAAWNAQHPKWRYRQESIFGRDRAVAARRALATLDARPTSRSTVDQWLTGRENQTEVKSTQKRKPR